ncbi:MAG TPA: hypothetical protein VKZ59_10280, partial [Acidobacteriota bacterium]|nr:hypothetical protein [Acidobacteriota bacterium]
RYTDPKFLGFEFVEIEQVIAPKSARLRFGERGGFEAHYIFGRNPGEPITVKNIVSWPIVEAIKGRTVYLRYKDRFNELDYQNTNANQGSFNLTDRDSGAQPMSAPR